MSELLSVREESAIEEDLDIYVSETVDCLICGAKFSQLNTHLQRTHDVTVQEYRAKYNNASIISEAVANKRKASVTKSWTNADERREKFSNTFKENNPSSNQTVREKICKTRKAQGNPWKGNCNRDGNPCQNPLCLGTIHTKTTGLDNPIMKNLNEVVEKRLATMKRLGIHSGFKDGCIRDGKTICPNCNSIHKDFTGENSPFGWPEIAKKNAEERMGHTFTGIPCPKCGVVHKDMSDTMSKIRLAQDEKFISSYERKAWKILDDNGVKYKHSVDVPGLLKPTNKFKYLQRHQFDIVIDDIKTVVEVYGCYHHGHTSCDKAKKLENYYLRHPEKKKRSNIDETVERNKEIQRQVEAAGWTYEIIWECEFIKEAKRRPNIEIINSPEDLFR